MLRHRGYTTWMLKSALINPKVFIVCKDGRCQRETQAKFNDMARAFHEESMRTVGRSIIELYYDWPKIIRMENVSDSIRGYDQFIPVIFDNSCYD